jgi:broad specificity phosphatase PhoE
VSHNRMQNALVHYLLQETYVPWRFDNCSVTILDYTSWEDPTIHVYNDTSYLS